MTRKPSAHSKLADVVNASFSANGDADAAGHLLSLGFPNGDGPPTPLIAHYLESTERISHDFAHTVGVFTTLPVKLKTFLGKSVTVSMQCEDGSLQYFNGIVASFSHVKIEAGVRFYTMVLRPWTYFLRLRENCCVFADRTARQQIEEIFGNYAGAQWEFVGTGGDAPFFGHQFNETDHNYVHRLLERMGWMYWYAQGEKSHKLIVSPSRIYARPIAGPGPDVPYQRSGVGLGEDVVYAFHATRQLVSARRTGTRFDFKMADTRGHQSPSGQNQGGAPSFENHHFEGTHTNPAGSTESMINARTVASDGSAKLFEGRGNSRYLRAGQWFNLTHGPFSDKEAFFIVEVRHRASNNDLVSTGLEGGYESSHVAVRKDADWLPPRFSTCHDHRIDGISSAIVVGPPGDEIHTNEYGEVLISYPWDRLKKRWTWVRVASGFASKGFGLIAIPRVGDNVLIMFLEGDANQPVIIASLYNGGNRPAWTLPANKTQSGITTRSTPKGDYTKANCIRFEDKIGEEELWVHAERDQRIEVEHDESHTVGNDRTSVIGNDKTTTVKRDRAETVNRDACVAVGHNRSETVSFDEDVTIGGNRSVKIGQNKSETIARNKAETIGGSKTETVAVAKTLSVGGLFQTSVGAAMNTTVGLSQSEQVGLSKSVAVTKSYSTDVGEEYSLTVGEASVVFKSDGTIKFKCVNLIIEASGNVTCEAEKNVAIKGKKVDVN